MENFCPVLAPGSHKRFVMVIDLVKLERFRYGPWRTAGRWGQEQSLIVQGIPDRGGCRSQESGESAGSGVLGSKGQVSAMTQLQHFGRRAVQV